MEWNGCMSLLQGYLENSPLIVLGSGASMPYPAAPAPLSMPDRSPLKCTMEVGSSVREGRRR